MLHPCRPKGSGPFTRQDFQCFTNRESGTRQETRRFRGNHCAVGSTKTAVEGNPALSRFFSVLFRDTLNKMRGAREKTCLHPHLASPVKGEGTFSEVPSMLTEPFYGTDFSTPNQETAFYRQPVSLSTGYIPVRLSGAAWFASTTVPYPVLSVSFGDRLPVRKQV